MAESSPLKRSREETHIEGGDVDEAKRQKKPSSYNDILSLLDDAEDEQPAEALSHLMTSLQHELSSDSNNTAHNNDPESLKRVTSSSSSSNGDEADDKERVMRHLLEASDDELGIPSMEASFNKNDNSTDDNDELGFNSVDGLAFVDGLWDLEDEAANYYALLQSELFM